MDLVVQTRLRTATMAGDDCERLCLAARPFRRTLERLPWIVSLLHLLRALSPPGRGRTYESAFRSSLTSPLRSSSRWER